MSDNTIELDLGTTAQKTTDGEKLPEIGRASCRERA